MIVGLLATLQFWNWTRLRLLICWSSGLFWLLKNIVCFVRVQDGCEWRRNIHLVINMEPSSESWKNTFSYSKSIKRKIANFLLAEFFWLENLWNVLVGGRKYNFSTFFIWESRGLRYQMLYYYQQLHLVITVSYPWPQIYDLYKH